MFKLKCTSYDDGEAIAGKHTHRSVSGENVSPGFSWSDPPINAKSFAFSIVDPHPVAKDWVHWLIINIPFSERSIAEAASRTEALPRGSLELYSSYKELGYGGPAPPPGSGRHPYVATVYALNVPSLNLGKNTSLGEFLRTIEGKVIAEAEMTGFYEIR